LRQAVDILNNSQKPINLSQMNKRLFVVRSATRKMLVVAVLIVFVAAGIFVTVQLWHRSKSFLKYHDKTYYSPSNKLHNGFYGKANDILAEALTEQTKVPYSLNCLDSVYKRLKFYFPANSDTYLVSPDDIRLIGVDPSPGDRAFYFNSYLSNLLDLQKRNLSARYFNIKFDRQRQHIIQITVDSSRFKLALQNGNWNGTLTFKDPFSEVQPGIPYLVIEHKILPFFISNVTPLRFLNSECSWQIIHPFSKAAPFKIEDFDAFFSGMNDEDPGKSKPYLIDYDTDDSLKESSIRLLNTGSKLLLQTRGVDVDVNYDNLTKAIKGDMNTEIPNDADLVKLTIRPRGLKKEYSVLVLRKSPLSVASHPENIVSRMGRVHIDSSYCDLFTSQEINQFEAGIQPGDHLGAIKLSSNILLAKYLENKLKSKVAQLKHDSSISKRADDSYEISVCLMDISTGEIIAAPYYSNTFTTGNFNELTDLRNFNLVRHNIGSTFKPLLSFAAVYKYKSLAQFRMLPGFTAFINEKSCKVMGYPVPAYGMTDDKKPKRPSFWPLDSVNRVSFLATSNDNYPVGLTMLALTEGSNTNTFKALTAAKLNNTLVNSLMDLNSNDQSRILVKNGVAVLKDIANSSFIQLLSGLYGVRGSFEDDNQLTFDPGVIADLHISRHNFFSLYPDLSNFGTESFGNINAGPIDFRNLEWFVLGEQNNVWSNVKLAEAYSRLLSKRRVNATLLARDKPAADYLFRDPHKAFNNNQGTLYSFPADTATIESSWAKFMDDWGNAVKMHINSPLLQPAFEQFCAGVNDHNRYNFYCKTGTPEANGDLSNTSIYKKGHKKMWMNEGLFVFGITNTETKFPKGLVGVIYIKHLSLDKTKTINSGIARDFFTADVYQKILFYNKNRFIQ
jgi:hypothetical protein